jgi:hypothetical protein
MTKVRGLKYVRYNGSGYCPKCGMFGYREIWQSYLSKIYEIGSCRHDESIEGKQFTIKRCWY